MRKFKVIVDLRKEEAYLNEMAKQGYLLISYSILGIYHFMKGIPQDLRYKVDYRGFRNKSDFEDYKALFEDAGWQHIYGTRYSYNQYFIPKEGNPNEEIFSTIDSQAQCYKRQFEVCIVNVAAALLYVLLMLLSVNFKLTDMAFLTPGLWEKEGSAFWGSFFFELPFAVLRLVPFFLLSALGIAYGIWAYQVKGIYKKMLIDAQNGK